MRRKSSIGIVAASLSTAALMIGLAPTGFAATGQTSGPSAHASAQASLHKKTWVATPPFRVRPTATATYQSGYTPAQVRTAYGINSLSQTGKGETIAIIDAYGSPSIQSDLAAFDKQFGLPTANLTIAYSGKKPHRSDGGWALETSLDVEWAHAIAPDANIMLVVAPSASTSDLLAAIDYATAHGAQVVSNSWGGSEFSGESSDDTHFQNAGVVYTASAGDSGAQAEWPAVSSDVLSVGGTTLNIQSNGTYVSESAWASSGGDASAYESRPAYQNNWQSVVGSARGVPDIAWDADPNTGAAVYDTTNYQGQSGWWVVGGTSFGAPSIAAVVALADQGRATPLSTPDIQNQLYSLAGSTGSSGYTTNFHDITSGNDGNPALAGYDLVTGLGTPKANALVPNLNAAP